MKRNSGFTPLRPLHRGASAGFTLVELLIVIMIIGILASLSFAGITYAISMARLATCKNNLKELYTMQTNYAVQHNSRTGNLPSETGGAFWLKLTQTVPPMIEEEQLSILDCPVSAEENARGRVQYRGPSENVNLRRSGPIGADLAGAHGAGRGGNVLLRDGGVLTFAENDPVWAAAATKTKP